MKSKLLLAIPAYNCEHQVGRVLGQMTPKFKDYIAEVIVIDNRSKDSTLESAIQKAKTVSGFKVSVFRNVENYNLGGTHKVAFRYCIDQNYDGVIILHGDDQGALEDFYQVISQGHYKNYDCVLGARFQKLSRITGYSKFRILGNYIFNWLYSAIVCDVVTDMGSGLNLYNRSIIEADFFCRMPDDLTFNNCMLLATYAYKKKVRFEPISWREEDQVSNASLFKQARKLIQYLATYCFNKKAFFETDFRVNKINDYRSEKVYSS